MLRRFSTRSMKRVDPSSPHLGRRWFGTILGSVLSLSRAAALLLLLQSGVGQLVAAQQQDIVGTRALQAATELDCSFPKDIILSSGAANDTQQLLLFRSIINPTTQTVAIELEYQGSSDAAVWLGLAFVVRELMVPSTAVIGLPDDETIQKYDISSRSLSGVTAFSDSSSLTETSITSGTSLSESEQKTITILRFTKPLAESMEPTVVSGENLINWAYGSSAVLGMHANKGSTLVNISECRALTPAPTRAPSVPTVPPTRPPYTPAPFVTLPAGTPLDCSALDRPDASVTVSALAADGVSTYGLTVRGIINPVDLTVTIRAEYKSNQNATNAQGGAWIGFAFSTDGLMVPNTGAVIGIPGSPGVVEKFDLSVRDLVGVEPLQPIELQTLTNTSIVVEEQQDEDDGSTTTTILQFTQLLSEPEQPVQVYAGQNQFIWAVGASSELTGTHIAKGAAFIDLGVCTVLGDANSSPAANDGGEQVPSLLPPVASSPVAPGKPGGTSSSFTSATTLWTALAILFSSALFFAVLC